MRTAEEDKEEDTDDEPFVFDDPEVITGPKKIVRMLLEPSQRTKKIAPKQIVGQFQPRKALKSPHTKREMPKRGCARSCHHLNGEDPPIFDISDVTPEGGTSGKLGWEPKNIRQARAHVTWLVWQAAMEKVVRGLLKRGTWTVVRLKDIPRHIKIMGSQFVFKDKLTGTKARLVV